jgi:hypothetical protein
VPFAVRVVFSDALGLFDFRSFVRKVMVDAAYEVRYRIAVRSVILVHFGEQVVPEQVYCTLKGLGFQV